MFIIITVITGRRCGPANVGLWQTGGGGQASDLTVSVVGRGRDGPRRQALPPVALLRLLLLLTCFLTEERRRHVNSDSKGHTRISVAQVLDQSGTDCVLLKVEAHDAERCMACQRCATHRCLSSADSAAYTHTHAHTIVPVLVKIWPASVICSVIWSSL